MVYSDRGLNGMSQAFHSLYRARLARGYWRDRPRPILINNWEATYFDFDEQKILQIVRTAKRLGIELFVLDDGWFGNGRMIILLWETGIRIWKAAGWHCRNREEGSGRRHEIRSLV